MNFDDTQINAFNVIYQICNENYNEFESFKHIGIEKCLFVALYRGLISTKHIDIFVNVISNCICCSRHLHTCSHNMNLDKSCQCKCRRFIRRCVYAKILYDKFLRSGEMSCLLNNTINYLFDKNNCI